MESTVILQRKHGVRCPAGHRKYTYTFESDERRRGAKVCQCAIYASGTLGGVWKRVPTRQRDWALAKRALAPYLAAGSWASTTQPPPPPAPGPAGGGDQDRSPEPGAQTKIEDAIEAHLERHRKARTAKNTIKKYREVLGLMRRFAKANGLGSVEDWGRGPWVRQLVDGWDNGQLTKTKKLSVLKGFFKPFVEDRILAVNPAAITIQIHNRAARDERGGTNSRQKSPFSDAEIERMLAACADVGRPQKIRQWPRTGEGSKGQRLVNIGEYCDYHRKWTGEDLADFITLSKFTGLRISDVATFDAERLRPDGTVRVRSQKNNKWVCVPVPEKVQAMIRRRAAIHGPLIFGKHTTADVNVIADVWRRKLKALWAKCGPWEEKPTPHRFRHTFIRVLLERGVPVADVAELAGDTEQMIRRYYGAWVAERQDRLNRIVRAAFADHA